MKKISRLERLAKKDERQIIRRIFTLSVFSIILAIFIFTLGIPLLGNLADTFETIFKKGQDKAAESQTLVSPTLDPLPEATNSAEVTIGGISTTGILVAIYRDDEKVGTADVKDGRFLFEKLTLKKELLALEKAIGICVEELPHTFPSEKPGNGFLILQTLRKKTVWNFSFITTSLKFINLKIDAHNGSINSTESITLVQR